MKKTTLILVPILVLTILGGTILITIRMISRLGSPAAGGACSESMSSGCTVFTIAKGDQVFFGGNDDWTEPDSYYWVDPGYGEDYGAIWIGYPDNMQQGIMKGLAYDANGLPWVDCVL